jgi:hypothetical protein
MKKFVMMLALVGICSSAFAHIPEGRVFGVFQWPSNNLPVLDGDISEWDAVPDELWIDLDDPDMVAGEGDVGREKDRSDIYFRFAMGWNDETDRLYYVYDRYDDVWDRDAVVLVAAVKMIRLRSVSTQTMLVDGSIPVVLASLVI